MYSFPPARAPKSQLAVEEPSTGGCWSLPEKRYSMCKDQKKLKWDCRRGMITTESNPTPAVWVTHKLENNTKEALPLLQRFWTPCQASQPGDPAKGRGIPRESDLEGQQDLITRLPQNWRKQDSSLGGYKRNLAHTKTQRKGAVTPLETEPKYLLVLGVSCGNMGQEVLTTRMGELAAAVLEGSLWCKLSWRSPLTQP